MDHKDDDSVSNEMNNNMELSSPATDESNEIVGSDSNIEGMPLANLKAIILSIDWEINNEIMDNLIEQTEILKKTYKDDKIVQLFLELLGSAGKYMKVEKAGADPEVIKVLNALYASLEIITLTKEITEKERKKTFLIEAKKFKKLQRKLSPEKYDGEIKPVIDKNETGLDMLKEIKLTIKVEFNALKKELKTWIEKNNI